MKTLALFSTAKIASDSGRDSLLPTAEALRDARQIVFRALQKGSWLHSNFLVSRIVRDIARARNGCPLASLADTLGRWFFMRDLIGTILQSLVDANVLESRAMDEVEVFDLLAVPDAGGEWAHVLVPEGWRSIDSTLYAAFASISSRLPTLQMRERVERELGELVIGPIDHEHANRAFDLLWSSGLVRSRRSTVVGDPRPALYLRLESDWRARQSQWHERAIESARSGSSINPYAPHLSAVVTWVPTIEEAEALPWALRTWQLPEFDTATVVWDVSEALSRGLDLDAAARALKSASAAAGVRMRFFVDEQIAHARVEWRQAMATLSASIGAPTTVMLHGAGDASPTRVIEAQPSWSPTFAEPDTMLTLFESANDASLLSRCYASLLTRLECGAGDTFTVTMSTQSQGCPLCVSSAEDRMEEIVARARAIVKARAQSPGFGFDARFTPPRVGEEPYGRRSCM